MIWWWGVFSTWSPFVKGKLSGNALIFFAVTNPKGLLSSRGGSDIFLFPIVHLHQYLHQWRLRLNLWVDIYFLAFVIWPSFEIWALTFIWNLSFDLCHSNSFYLYIWTLLGSPFKTPLLSVVVDFVLLHETANLRKSERWALMLEPISKRPILPPDPWRDVRLKF